MKWLVILAQLAPFIVVGFMVWLAARHEEREFFRLYGYPKSELRSAPPNPRNKETQTP